MSPRIVRSFGLFSAIALTAAACGDATGPNGLARVQVVLTDAPADYIETAMVDIGAVELLPAGDGERIVLSEDGTDGPINLLDLQNGATQLLADAEIEAGEYREVRLIVESASVTLLDPYTFRDGEITADLRVPSGAQTGIKLKLEGEMGDGESEGGVTIGSGETVLVLDFDVNQSFRIQGNPETPAGINGVSFQPTLRVAVNDVAGSISGTVSTALAGAVIDGLVVTATPDSASTGFGAYQTQTATAATDSTGAYTIYFLVPGDYAVTVAPADTTLLTNPESADVSVGEGEDVTGVDFSIVSS